MAFGMAILHCYCVLWRRLCSVLERSASRARLHVGNSRLAYIFGGVRDHRLHDDANHLSHDFVQRGHLCTHLTAVESSKDIYDEISILGFTAIDSYIARASCTHRPSFSSNDHDSTYRSNRHLLSHSLHPHLYLSSSTNIRQCPSISGYRNACSSRRRGASITNWLS